MNATEPQVILHLPLALREFTGGQDRLHLPGRNVAGVLEALRARYPLVGARVLEAGGGLRRHVNLFLGEQNVRDLQGLDTPLVAGDELFLIPAVAGG